MSVAEDRRRIDLPPAGAAGGRHRCVHRPGHELLVPPGRGAPAATRSWPRTTTSGRWRCARRAACCSTGTAGCWSRTATPSPSRSSASTPTISRAPSGCCRSVAGLDQAQVRADRRRATAREPTYRPIVVVEDASLAQVAAVTRAAPRIRTARRRGRGSADAAVSDGRDGRASVRLRRRSERQRRWPDGASQGAIIGQQGFEKVYNELLMGQDGAKARGRQQPRPRDPDARGSAARRGPPPAADDRLRPAAGGRGRLPACRVQRRGAHPGPAQRRGAHLREPAVVRPERLRRRASIARRGRRSTPTSCGRCRTASSRGAIRPGRPSRSSSRPPRSKKGSSRRTSSVNCTGGATFFGRYFKCHLKGGHGVRGHAARDREVVQRVLLHARQHARRGQDPQVGGEARPGRQDRHRPAERAGEPRARPPSGS